MSSWLPAFLAINLCSILFGDTLLPAAKSPTLTQLALTWHLWLKKTIEIDRYRNFLNCTTKFTNKCQSKENSNQVDVTYTKCTVLSGQHSGVCAYFMANKTLRSNHLSKQTKYE